MRPAEDRVGENVCISVKYVQGSSAVTDWVGIVGTCIVAFNVANLLLL